MALTDKDIKKLSHLAKINISSDDEMIVLKKLDGIMKLIDTMQKIDTTNVQPMSHALDIYQTLRDDVVTEKNQKEKFLQLGPESNEDYFIVPRVVE